MDDPHTYQELAGRVMRLRIAGRKLVFMDIAAGGGRIQVVASQSRFQTPDAFGNAASLAPGFQIVGRGCRCQIVKLYRSRPDNRHISLVIVGAATAKG
jgi:hypothetical protein